MLLDHLELTVQGIIIEENEDQIMEEVHLFEDMDKKTRRLLKIYIKLGWKKLNNYYGKLTSAAYAAAVVFHPCKKWRALEQLWNQLPSCQTSEWKQAYQASLTAIWDGGIRMQRLGPCLILPQQLETVAWIILSGDWCLADQLLMLNLSLSLKQGTADKRSSQQSCMSTTNLSSIYQSRQLIISHTSLTQLLGGGTQEPYAFQGCPIWLLISLQ